MHGGPLLGPQSLASHRRPGASSSSSSSSSSGLRAAHPPTQQCASADNSHPHAQPLRVTPEVMSVASRGFRTKAPSVSFLFFCCCFVQCLSLLAARGTKSSENKSAIFKGEGGRSRPRSPPRTSGRVAGRGSRRASLLTFGCCPFTQVPQWSGR